MEALKVYVSEETAEQFREHAMRKYKYRKGALSRAAEIALKMWVESIEK